MGVFRLPGAEGEAPDNPEELFDQLSRPFAGLDALRAHQADLLRQYRERHVEEADVAMSLPTGDGKTLVGLLIGEWRRRKFGERVAYICPTKQLARQVADQARAAGFSPVLLVGPKREWPPADSINYHASRAIGISTYAALFNTNPGVDDAQCLVLDDAHAGEQFVSSPWSVALDRAEQPELYQTLLAIFGAAFDDAYRHELASEVPDWGQPSVRLVPWTFLRQVTAPALAALDAVDGNHKFPLSFIRDQFDRCMVYVAWSGILIRPYIPPTFTHRPFDGANQRVYMSATLGDSGELERAFGRRQISRIPIPAGRDRRAPGRRFFLLPILTEDADPDGLVQAVLQDVRKALVLCPSRRRVDRFEDQVAPLGLPTFDAPELEQRRRDFIGAESGLLVLANRYDGIDLPGESCRLIVLDGMPAGIDLQERFLYSNLGAVEVLNERILTRFVQGAGRCTRAAGDSAAVLVTDPQLVSFLMRREVREALHPELQAELELSMQSLGARYEDVLGQLREFRERGPEWTGKVEPYLVQRRGQLERSVSDDTNRLLQAAPFEVDAWQAIWRGDWGSAATAAREAVMRLPGEGLRPYRALWLYLCAQAYERGADDGGQAFRDQAAQLMEQFRQAASKTMFHFQVTSTRPVQRDGEIDRLTAELVAAALSRNAALQIMSDGRFERGSSALLDKLTATASGQYEEGLRELGTWLGFATERPTDAAAPDSIWRSTAPWICFEAKTEASPNGSVSATTVRQANTHVQWAGAKYQAEAPPDSFTVLVTPQRSVEPDAETVAVDELFMVSPEEVLEIGRAVVTAWRGMRMAGGSASTPSAARERLALEFGRSGISGPDLITRLRRIPIRPTGQAQLM